MHAPREKNGQYKPGSMLYLREYKNPKQVSQQSYINYSTHLQATGYHKIHQLSPKALSELYFSNSETKLQAQCFAVNQFFFYSNLDTKFNRCWLGFLEMWCTCSPNRLWQHDGWPSSGFWYSRGHWHSSAFPMPRLHRVTDQKNKLALAVV